MNVRNSLQYFFHCFIYVYQILFIAMSILYMCLIPIMKHTSVEAYMTQEVTKQAFWFRKKNDYWGYTRKNSILNNICCPLGGDAGPSASEAQTGPQPRSLGSAAPEWTGPPIVCPPPTHTSSHTPPLQRSIKFAQRKWAWAVENGLLNFMVLAWWASWS